MQRSLFVAALLLALNAVALTTEVSAADKFPSFTNIADAGDDYFFQGEYSGNSATLGRVGLQIISQGAGAYHAVLFPGGLPGDGWNHSQRFNFTGKREASLLRLQGEAASIEVQIGLATLRDPSKRQLGVLRRVQRVSPTMGLAPPKDATILFNGTGTSAFDEKAKIALCRSTMPWPPCFQSRQRWLPPRLKKPGSAIV